MKTFKFVEKEEQNDEIKMRTEYLTINRLQRNKM